MDKHGKKMVAPIIATVLIAIYFIFYFTMVVSTVEGMAKYVLGIIPLLFVVVIIKVCIERIKEIKEGEEDDLSKY